MSNVQFVQNQITDAIQLWGNVQNTVKEKGPNTKSKSSKSKSKSKSRSSGDNDSNSQRDVVAGNAKPNGVDMTFITPSILGASYSPLPLLSQHCLPMLVIVFIVEVIYSQPVSAFVSASVQHWVA